MKLDPIGGTAAQEMARYDTRAQARVGYEENRQRWGLINIIPDYCTFCSEFERTGSDYQKISQVAQKYAQSREIMRLWYYRYAAKFISVPLLSGTDRNMEATAERHDDQLVQGFLGEPRFSTFIPAANEQRLIVQPCLVMFNGREQHSTREVLVNDQVVAFRRIAATGQPPGWSFSSSPELLRRAKLLVVEGVCAEGDVEHFIVPVSEIPHRLFQNKKVQFLIPLTPTKRRAECLFDCWLYHNAWHHLRSEKKKMAKTTRFGKEVVQEAVR